MNIYLVERKLPSPWDDGCHSAIVAARTRGGAKSLVADETGERIDLWRMATATNIGAYTALDEDSHVILLSWGPTARPLPDDKPIVRP